MMMPRIGTVTALALKTHHEYFGTLQEHQGRRRSAKADGDAQLVAKDLSHQPCPVSWRRDTADHSVKQPRRS